jgi:hypothetical protein
MAARQVRVLAGSASALAALMLALGGCAAAGHLTANAMPHPASQTAAGHTSPRTAGRAVTVVRQVSPLLKCADPVALGRAQRVGGAPAAAGPAAQTAAHGGSASPIPLATTGQVTREVGVASRSQPGLVMLCGPAAHCPPGFRGIYPRARSGRPPVLLPRRVACVPRFRPGTPPPEPLVTPEPYRTPPLRTMPP